MAKTIRKTKTVESSNGVDRYIASLAPAIRPTLETLRQTIKKVIPDAEEVISYSMPAFRGNGIIVWYAAFKNHYSLFPTAKGTEVFKVQLEPYVISKGTIRFDYDKPMPAKLIRDIVKYRWKEDRARTKNKKKPTKG